MDNKAKEALEKQVELLSKASEYICQNDLEKYQLGYPVSQLVALADAMVNVVTCLCAYGTNGDAATPS